MPSSRPLLLQRLGLILLSIASPVIAQVCAVPGRDGAPSIPASGVVNSYWAPVAATTLTAGAQAGALALGAKRAGSADDLAPGDLVLMAQMQCSDINFTNTNAYGDGTAGGLANGYINPTGTCLAGQYEFVRAGAATTATSLDLNGVTLKNSYVQAASTAALGRRSFQVVRVPQFSSLTLSANLTAPVWNGSTGGMVVLDVAGELNWNGKTVDVSGLGFRGGQTANRNINDNPTGTIPLAVVGEFVYDNRGAGTLRHAGKGEGIAGTPENLTGGDGYPGGSFSRGAPGNAGGGGAALRHCCRDNGGGGGGSNGGDGGRGGTGWANTGGTPRPLAVNQYNWTDTELYGFGAKAFAERAVPRLIMGGGGGSGDLNDTTAANSFGGNGGGIVMIRAGSFSGTGTINANGAQGKDQPGNDAGGGGGAGGSVLLLSNAAGGAVGTLSVNAAGGRGGNSYLAGTGAHGPGGGGGGGVIFTSGTLEAATTVAGGVGGQTNVTQGNASDHGAAGGTGLIGALSATPADDTTGIAGARCVPQLTTLKTTSTPSLNVGTANATYTIRVSNAAGRGDAVGVSVADALSPTNPFTYLDTQSITLTPASGSSAPVRTATTDPTAGSAAPAWGTFTIPGGASVDITFRVNLNGAAAGTYQNPASASFSNPVRTADASTATASAPYDPASSAGENVTLTANGADVITTKVGPTGVEPGGNMGYTITVKNAGPQSADNVVVTDTLPAGLTDVTVSDGGTLSGNTVTWNLGTLTNGQTVTRTISAKAPATPGAITNIVSSTSTTPDPVPANNDADATNDPVGQYSRVVTVVSNGLLASSDAVITPFNTPVNLDPPANDAPTAGATLVPGSIDLDPDVAGQQTSKTVPGKGTYVLNPDGSVTFTPVNGFTGQVSIPYTIKDSSGATSNKANLTVTVTPPPPPVARDDVRSTPLNTPVVLDAPINDSSSIGTYLVPGSIDLNPATPEQDTTYTVPGKGTYTLEPTTGKVTFTPINGFTGTASIPYTIKDNLGQASNPANLTVTIVAALKANDDSATTSINTPVVLAAPSNDTTAEGAKLVPGSIDLDPSTPGQQTTKTVAGQGTFTLDPVTGNVTFTPEPGYTTPAGQPVTIPYTIQDTLGQTATANLSVTINPLPASVDDVRTTPLNTPINIPVGTNDQPNSGATIQPSTIDLDPSTPGQQTSKTVPGKGTFTLQPDGTVRFEPVTGFTGVAEIPYTVQDSTGATTAPANIKVTIVPPPGAGNDATSTPLNTPVTLPILSNDAAGNGAKLEPSTIDLDPSTPGQQTIKTVAGQGTFVLNPDGTVIFTPVAGYTGTSTIPYTVQDSLGQTSNTATITVTIRPANPTATNDFATTPAGTPVTLKPIANDSGNGKPLDPCTIDLNPATPAQDTEFNVAGQGKYVLNPAPACDVTFTPEAGFSGTVSIPYTIADTDGNRSNPADLIVTVNPLPAASPDVRTTPYNTPITIPVLQNDTPNSGSSFVPSTLDLDPDAPGIQDQKTVPGKGTFTRNPDGTVTFTPVDGYTGTVSIPYTVQDGTGATTNPTPITVTIQPPQAPVARDDATHTGYNTPVVFGLEGVPNIPSNDSGTGLNPDSIDLDPGTPGQQKVFTVPGKGTYELISGGVVSFTPVDGFVGTVSIPYTINDQFGQRSNPANITVTVDPPHLTLVKTALSQTVEMGGVLEYELRLTNDSGIDLNNVSLSDELPLGLIYRPGSSKLGGVSVSDPTASGRTLKWNIGNLAKGATAVLRFATIVGPGASDRMVNTASASGQFGPSGSPTTVPSNTASAVTVVRAGVFSPNSTIVGRVYFDKNDNNSFESGTDEPLAGARVYLSDGRYAVTDAQGRYSLPDIAPGLFAMRLDPFTVPYNPKSVPDDQGMPGSRYGRMPTVAGGIINEDFPLWPAGGAAVKVRSTTVRRGNVSLEKSVIQGGSGYAITLALNLGRNVANLSITDPVPSGAERSNVTLTDAAGKTLEVKLEGNRILMPGVLPVGTYTLRYTLTSNLPPDQITTDPDLSWDEVTR